MTTEQRIVCGDPVAMLEALLGAPNTTLACPMCKREMKCAAARTDPMGTARVEIPCPDCDPKSVTFPRYFDAAGNELKN